jgi:hypothetical protein
MAVNRLPERAAYFITNATAKPTSSKHLRSSLLRRTRILEKGLRILRRSIDFSNINPLLARYKAIDAGPWFLAVTHRGNFCPGAFEHTLNELLGSRSIYLILISALRR